MDDGLAEDLILDELFDLTLYRALRDRAAGDLRRVLGELVPVEEGHHAFWQKFFNRRVERLDAGRRIKLAMLLGLCRLLGPSAVHLVLEAIEIHGVRKYLALWESSRGQPLGEAVREILNDEFKHEDAIVAQITERRISPDRVRGIFLGFNDGLVEILGAVSGFFAAFHDPAPVLMAGITVAVAGALSMAAGAFVAAGSEEEVAAVERGRAAFLGGTTDGETPSSPWGAAALVGASYLVGALVPVLPVLLGARHAGISLLAGAAMIAVVSVVLGFLSGMDIRKRVLTNLVIIASAVGVSYVIGAAVKGLWGISV